MTTPEITVTLTDTEFSITELQSFIDTCRTVDGLSGDALVVVKLTNAKVTTSDGNPLTFEISASTAYRSKP